MSTTTSRLDLDGREWATVGAALGVVVASFLPWFGFAAGTVDFSVNAFSRTLPMFPLTALPALAGLTVAAGRLLPALVGGGLLTAPAARGNATARWWPALSEDGGREAPLDPGPVRLPPRSYYEPVLLGWSLLLMVLYLVVDFSAAGERYGFWLTLMLLAMVVALRGAEAGVARGRAGGRWEWSYVLPAAGSRRGVTQWVWVTPDGAPTGPPGPPPGDPPPDWPSA